jgi:hypothetical protein
VLGERHEQRVDDEVGANVGGELPAHHPALLGDDDWASSLD